MTELLHDIDAPSDAELISRVRGGDVAAYGELFSRHVDAARRLSRQLLRGPDADDLVSDAFAKVLAVLQGGGGPDVAFRAYLLTAVRRLHVDKIRAGSKLQSSDDMEMFDPGVPFQDTAVAAFESGAAAKAFASLPERWQLVLWHLEVEGQKPAEVAELLGMSPNSVSALAYRAREGLRQAFLTMHLSDISETDCRWVNEHLGAYVRRGLSKRDSVKVQAHLEDCRRCTAMYLELTEVNSNLRGIIAPLLLGAAATGYLSSTGAAGGGLGLMALLGRARDAVTANSGVATAGAIAAGVAAVATAGIMLLPSSEPADVVGANDPVAVVSTPEGLGSVDAGGPGDERDGADEPTPGAEATTGPEDVVPSVLPDGTTGEALPTADEPGGTAGTTPTDGTTGGPGEGTPSPTEPGPSEPGPSEPGPSEPGPSEPGPSEPGPSEPGPSEPGPSEPGPSEPGPSEEPPPPVSYKVVAGPATLQDGQVSFDLTGDPLPPKVYLSIQSDPAGVTFAGDGTCEVDSTLLTAECTLPGTGSLLAPLVRLAVAALGDPVRVTMPLTTPAVDSDVTITVAAQPAGPALDTVALRVDAPPPVLEPDLSLTSFDSPVSPTSVHDYTVTGTLGVEDYTGGAVFTISDADGRARFSGAPAGCTWQPSMPNRIECASVVGGAVALPVYVQDNRTEDTTVTITVTPLDGSTDTDTGNDSVTVVLERYTPLPVDAQVHATRDQNGNSGRATVVATVGVDDPRVPVTLTVSYDSQIAPPPDRCTGTAGGAVCDATGGGDFVFSVDVQRIRNEPRAGDLDFAVTVPEEYVDVDASNDTATATVERFADESDVGTATQGPDTSLHRATDAASSLTRTLTSPATGPAPRASPGPTTSREGPGTHVDDAVPLSVVPRRNPAADVAVGNGKKPF